MTADLDDPTLVDAVAAELDRHQGRGVGDQLVVCWCGWSPTSAPDTRPLMWHFADVAVRVVRERAAS